MITVISCLRESVVLNYVIFIAVQIKWAWDYLLYTPFCHYCPSADVLVRLPGFAFELPLRHFDDSDDDPTDCAICLCKLNGGDEVRELRCGHLFHRVCLDRWLGNGHATCPLCRNNLRLPSLVAELHQEVIMLDFFAGGRQGDRLTWWLR